MDELTSILIDCMKTGLKVKFDSFGYDQFRITMTREKATGARTTKQTIFPEDHISTQYMVDQIEFLKKQLY